MYIVSTYQLDTVLDDEEFTLVGLHCSLEAYRLVYFVNRHLGYSFRRMLTDVDIVYKEGTGLYQSYSFYDRTENLMIYLVSNKTWIESSGFTSLGMFGHQQNQVKRYLISEYRGVDYLVKLERSADLISTRELLADLNDIPHIISAYQLDVLKIKSLDHLIFT